MQISRHWRMNSQRYRLEGVRYQDGSLSLQSRPIAGNAVEQPTPIQVEHDTKKIVVHAA